MLSDVTKKHFENGSVECILYICNKKDIFVGNEVIEEHGNNMAVVNLAIERKYISFRGCCRIMWDNGTYYLEPGGHLNC